MDVVKVKDTSFIRQTKNRAILETDIIKAKNYLQKTKAISEAKKKENEEIDQIRSEITNLRSDITDIKNMLEGILSGIK